MIRHDFRMKVNAGYYDYIDDFGDFNLWYDSDDRNIIIVEYHENINYLDPIQEKHIPNIDADRIKAIIAEFKEDGDDDTGMLNYLRELLYM